MHVAAENVLIDIEHGPRRIPLNTDRLTLRLSDTGRALPKRFHRSLS